MTKLQKRKRNQHTVNILKDEIIIRLEIITELEWFEERNIYSLYY